MLFEKGKSFHQYPLKLVYLIETNPEDLLAQAMFVAPKRAFKKSPDRNLLKRRMRESYRLLKRELYQDLGHCGKGITIAIIYSGKVEEESAKILQSMQMLLDKLKSKIIS